MTNTDRRDPGGSLPEWESQVNALLDGELDEQSTAALKRAADEDHEKARAIIEAYELQLGMARLRNERGPASLRRKLRRIPRTQQTFPSRRRLVMVTSMGCVPLMDISLILMQPRQASPADVDLARRVLALAFSYIDKVGYRTGDYLQDVLGTELRTSVSDNLSKHFPFTEQSREEEKS